MASSVIDKQSEKFFEEYINNPSPTSHEAAGQKMWLKYIKPYIDTYEIDNYGTVVGIINPKAKFKVVIEAHADEISWMVHRITDKGFIYLLRNGGSDHMCAPSKRVNIHTDKKGIVKGLFGWPAIHLRKGKDDAPKVDTIFLDVGCKTKQEVLDLGIDIGNVVTYEDKYMFLNNRYYVGRAMDNRAGGFAIAQVAKLLKKNKKKLPFGLYIVNSVQEEVGLRGAQMIAERIRPNVAIVTDVAHDTSTPMIGKEKGEYECGKGPILAYGPSVHNNLLRLMIDTADKKKIPYQREANSRSTGTDTDAFAYAAGGIVSALISIPLRYMHTTVEMVEKSDLENVIRLFYETLLKIKNNHDFRYFK